MSVININKTNQVKFDFRSILAGIMIGLGSIIYCVCLPTSKIFGSFLFSLGLLTVIVQQYNLYTGKIGYLEFTCRDILRLVRIILGNILGVFLICFCVSQTRMFPEISSSANTLMVSKCNDSLLSLFCLGIGCGIMMFIAVDNFRKTEKSLLVVLPVMFFIACCFEHCIADAGYFFLSDVGFSTDILWRFLSIVAGNTVGSIIFYRLNNLN